jgi:hypothetical protein
MDRNWKALIDNLIELGYKPNDIKRIVMLYEMAKDNDELLRKTLENEHINQN